MDKFCRICSRSDEFHRFDLSTISQISNVRIDDMLVYCTQQQINSGDSLPQHICPECFTALNSAFVFRKLTYNSEHEFRRIINSNLNAENPVPSSIEFVPFPVEMVDHILPDDAFKEDELILQEPTPLVESNILPIAIEEALTIEENLICTFHQTSESAQIGKKRSRRSRNFGPTTYLCKDCGYSTQTWFNFKRHQTNQKHTTYSKIVTKQPLHIIKPKAFIPSKAPIKRQKKPEKKKRNTRHNQSATRTLYRCDDCGYQNYISFNFRRHQKNKNHTKTTTFHEPITDSENEALPINLNSNFIYSDEAMSISRILGHKRRHVQRKARTQMVKVKTEPGDDDLPTARDAVGNNAEDGRDQLGYGENLIKME